MYSAHPEKDALATLEQSCRTPAWQLSLQPSNPKLRQSSKQQENLTYYNPQL